MEKKIKIFKALSDPNRIRILKMLQKRPLCVCEITQILGLAASTTSKHLSILKETGMVFEQKEKQWVNYHLNRATQDQYIRDIFPLVHKWFEDDFTIINDSKEIDHTDRKNICRK